MLVTAYYSVEFGKGDGSDTIEWEIELNEEEAAAYRKALAIGEDPTEAPELEDVLCRARDEIIENELEILRETQDEYTLECLGELEEDPGELNELVHGKDPHALAFFGLSEADENDIFSWDANELEKLPLIRDFREDFVPTSPFDEGWSLSVWLEGNEGEAPQPKNSYFNYKERQFRLSFCPIRYVSTGEKETSREELYNANVNLNFTFRFANNELEQTSILEYLGLITE